MIGVDGLEVGRRAVADGVLTATVVQPLGVGEALRTYRAVAGSRGDAGIIPEDGNILLKPESHPAIAALAPPKGAAPR